jgi:hypothetical protein
MMEQTAAHEFVLARVHWAARVLHRFTTWGAAVALAAGTLLFVALLPWLPDAGRWQPLLAAFLALVLVVAPLRVMWHGARIRTVYGDTAHLMAVLEEVPGALGEVVEALQQIATPEARGVRRVVPAWQSLLAIRRVLVGSRFRDRFDALVAPLRPGALALTTTALWITLGMLVLAVPVAVLSLLLALLS